jgi:predicted Zn finger-like uncharacterized protein
MPIVVACPSCQTRLKVPDQSAGKKVKCPKCSAAIDVPLTGNEQIPDTPAAPGPAAPATGSAPAANGGDAGAAPKKSRKGLYIGLGVGAFLLLSCCCVGGIGTGVGIWYFGGERNDKVTKTNYDSLHEGMTLLEIEKILGTGKPATTDDVKAAYKTMQAPDKKSDLDKVIKSHDAAIAKDADYRWRNGDDYIFVIFDKSAKDNTSKSVSEIWCGNTGGMSMQLQKGSFPK